MIRTSYLVASTSSAGDSRHAVLWHPLQLAPLWFNSHACRACLMAKLQGPGIACSQCPICQVPAWQKDVIPLPKYQNVINYLEELLHVGERLEMTGVQMP